MFLSASIVVIGDEILGGFVRDENAVWLAGRLHAHGVELSRIVVVPDEPGSIHESLQTELGRPRPRLVLTTGGIGSTPDDLTYEAVAASLGRDLEVAEALAHKVDAAIAWTQAQGYEVTDEFVDHMMRMARVPAGATLLRPSGSWAPGVRVDVDGGIEREGGATVLILPGVPSQLRTIVAEVVEPDLLSGRGRSVATVELTHGFPESVLNPCFARLGRRYPDLRVGSYPGAPMVVRLRGRPDEVEAARLEVERYVDDLEAGPVGERLRHAWDRRTAARTEREPT